MYGSPHLIAYSDGEVRQEFTFVYAAEIESGDLKIDDESKEASWVPLMSAIEVPLAESQRRRLKDVLEYQKHRQRFLSNVDFPDFLFAFAIEPKIPTRAV
jgi:hypothetical protein